MVMTETPFQKMRCVACFRAASTEVNACLIVCAWFRFPGFAWLFGFPVSRVAQYDHLSMPYRGQAISPNSAPLISADFSSLSVSPRPALCVFRVFGASGLRFPCREFVL
jgi:hypothetical protein